MNLKIFTIFDAKAEAYQTVFTARATGEAIRQFADMANDHDTQIGRHPADFTLFELGEFDLHSGIISPLETKRPLGVAHEYIESVQ